jgi:hypothetical protein
MRGDEATHVDSKGHQEEVECGKAVPRRGVIRRGVRASREVIVGKGKLRFGIWAKISPTWAWFVGGSGKVEWTIGGKDLPLRHQRDAPHHASKLAQWDKLAEVDAVLCQGWRPPFVHSVWSQPSVKTLVWFNQGLQRNEGLPTGWSLTKKTLCHARAGGITNAKSVMFIAMRLGRNSMRWKQRADGFPNTLRQVVDSTLGGKMCVRPEEKGDMINTAMGLLDSKKKRTAWVTVPTVYSKDKWAVRRLNPRELGHVMDLPRDKIVGMSAVLLVKVLTGAVPGKLMALVAVSLEITESGASAEEADRIRKRKADPEYARDRKQVKTLGRDHEEDAVEEASAGARRKRAREPQDAPLECAEAQHNKTLRKSILGGRGPRELSTLVETVEEEEEDTVLHSKSTVTDKAVKADKAKVLKHLWNSRVFELESLKRMDRFNDEEKESILDKMRKALHVVWKQKDE